MTATIGKPYSKYKDYAESYHVAGTRKEDSLWRGKLAQTLGYEESIHQFAYDLASVGKDSYGRQLRKYQKNSRPAICDVTLNAPKSVSVEALVHSNPVAVAAHDFGVESSINFVEQYLLFSQVKRQGQVERVHTDKALIGSFRQRDNREGEPHLHTHNVIFNVGWVEGKWRSLANEQVYLGKLTIGAIYQNDTAYHLHQAGYQTYWDTNGQFELAGNPKRLLEQTFAQRTEKIEAYLAEQGLNRTTATPEQLNAANRATRNKKAYDKDEQAQILEWRSLAATSGIVPCQKISQQELEFHFSSTWHRTSPLGGELKNKIPEALSSPPTPFNYSATRHEASGILFTRRCQEIVIAASERLSEKRSCFGYLELLRESCRLSQGKYLSNQIQKAISQSRELVAVTSNTPYPSYTTRTLLQRERQILSKAIQGKSTCAAICDAALAAVVAQKFTLNRDQTIALEHIATSQDSIVLVQGSAGVGKTRSLSALKDLMGDRPLIGCAVGGLQAEALEAESGIRAQTLESLIRQPLAEFPQDTLIVVDEAGVVSNRQMHQLLERAKSSNCRLLLVGDTKQLSAVEQGNPFQLLQTRAGLSTAFISQNMRQKDSQLKAVVDLCEAQRPEAAFDLLDATGKIREIHNETQLILAIVDDYLTRPIEQRRNTLIMATTHRERSILTQAIRNRLQKQGELSGAALSIEVLQKKDLDKHDLLLADHYQAGDLVRFWRNRGSFTRGEFYRVSATHPEERRVELVDAKGQTYTLDLHRYKEREIFSPQRIEIKAGEEMRFTAGIKNSNGKQVQVNGQRFRVEAIDPHSRTIEISTKGKRFTVTPEDLRHSDYRWISTVHSLQGATAQYAIFSAIKGDGALLSKESWYVAASRAKLEFTVYCGDSRELRESIQLGRAQRPAIDLIQPTLPAPQQAVGENLETTSISPTTQSHGQVNDWDSHAAQLELILDNDRHEAQQREGESPDSSEFEPTPIPSSPRPEILAAQFQILTDQTLANLAVYQNSGIRIERRDGFLTAAIEGKQVDLHSQENLLKLVSQLQTAVNNNDLLSLYQECEAVARLEKSILDKAIKLVKLFGGNYKSQNLSVRVSAEQLEIESDKELAFKFQNGAVERPDNLSSLNHLDTQLQTAILNLEQAIIIQQQQKLAAIAESNELEVAKERIKLTQQERGHELTR